MSQNRVAKILKRYAKFNAVVVILAGCIAGIAIGDEPGVAIAVVSVAVSAVVNFAIYAAGEAIQLLQDIKDNIGKNTEAIVEKPQDDEVPEI